ncbi:armadillo-type protein [Chytriomyces cf. hyalinus JEL632]|nr:armadillo-type protein [Chytriomyces cf. hyalinus JEL632]
MTRPEEINAIVESVGRYDSNNLLTLEAYVLSQLSANSPDPSANLAVLKLYQFNPALTNIATVTAILSLALASLPDPHFNLAISLIAADVSSNKYVADLIRIQALLESCRFTQFWAAYDAGIKVPTYDAKIKAGGAPVSISQQFPAFATQIRKYITSTLGYTYQQISLAQFKAYVHLDKKELTAWISQSGCSVNSDDATLVDFPSTPENIPKPALVKENIKFEQLTKIIGVSRISV